MTFKITVARQPFAVEFETGSVSEAIGVLQAEGTEFANLFDINFGNGHGGNVPSEDTTDGGAATSAAPKKPARKPRTPKEAVAPPPIPVPTLPVAAPAPPAPDLAATNANGIPAFLDRTAAPSPPPPPLLPTAPPIAAALPPVSGPIGQKIIAELFKRGDGAADNGQALSDWLAASIPQVIIKGATLQEAISVLRMTGDEKLAGVAQALGV
jgi:hypothetical protein